MTDIWLIDGYNLLHGISPSRKGGKPSREALCDMLAGFAAGGPRRVILVLDGKGQDAELSARDTKSFTAVYSNKVSADTYIEKYLFDHRGKARLFVVTGDRAIANVARGGGASVLSPKLFMEELKGVQSEASDTLFDQKVKSHGFNRPFDRKMKEKGL
jgi:predicted RNA-binding protein with PIN domain